jgi:hypothetical protein
MGKAIERPVPAARRIGRFYVAIDQNEEPVDWDCAVARFLLAVRASKSRASATALVGQPSLAPPPLVPNGCSGPNLLLDCCGLQRV